MTRKIMALLGMLVEQSGEKVSAGRLENMMTELAKGDERTICEALGRLLNSSRRFPIVSEILAEAGASPPSVEGRARETAERIYTGIGTFWALVGESGQVKWRERIVPFIGEIGVEVVRLNGGWNHLCEIVMETDATTWKAQWRELAAELIRKQRAGTLGQAPRFDTLPPRPEVLALCEKVKSIDKGKA